MLRGGSVLGNKKVRVVLPAYNAAKTLRQTYDDIPQAIVDDVISIDDASNDATVEMARSLASRRSATNEIGDMAATRRPATRRPWPEGPILS
jgi:hypothetical protein